MESTFGKNLMGNSAKFLIGFVATMSGLCVPRLFAAISLWDANPVKRFLDLQSGDNQILVTAALLLAVLVGVITMILQWGEGRKAADIFFYSLTIPALIGGGVNSTFEINQSRKDLDAGLQIIRGAESFGSGDFELLPTQEPTAPPSGGTSWLGWGVPEAQAQSGGNTGVLVVLYESASEATARQNLAEFQKQGLPVSLIRARTNYLVIFGKGVMAEQRALEHAISLRHKDIPSKIIYVK